MKLIFIIIFSGLCSAVKAQPGYAVNDITGNFSIANILNHSSVSSSFQQFKDRLLIVDFFGTWCVPCVRALPKLSALQEKYKNEINILLVSEETQVKLENFIKKQTNFSFPVVIDEQKNFIKLFQPPSYPYTVIVGKDGRVIAIPSPEEITEANIDFFKSCFPEFFTPLGLNIVFPMHKKYFFYLNRILARKVIKHFIIISMCTE